MKRLATVLFLCALLLSLFALPAQAASYTFQDASSYTGGLAEHLYTYDKDSHMQKQYRVPREQMEYFISQYINMLAEEGAFAYLGASPHGDYIYHSFGATNNYAFDTFKVKSYGKSLTPQCCLTVQYEVGGKYVYVRYSKDLETGDRGYRMTADPNYVPPTPKPTPTPRPTAAPTPVPVPTAVPTARPTAVPTPVPVPTYYYPPYTAQPTYYYPPYTVRPTYYYPIFITPTPRPTYSVPQVTTPPVSSSQILLSVQDPAAYTRGALMYNYALDTPAYHQYCYKVPTGSTADYVTAYVNTLIYNEPTLVFAGTSYSTDGKMVYYSFAPRTGYNYGTFRAYQYGQPMTPTCCLTIGYREGLVYLLTSLPINLADKGLRY